MYIFGFVRTYSVFVWATGLKFQVASSFLMCLNVMWMAKENSIMVCMTVYRQKRRLKLFERPNWIMLVKVPINSFHNGNIYIYICIQFLRIRNGFSLCSSWAFASVHNLRKYLLVELRCYEWKMRLAFSHRCGKNAWMKLKTMRIIPSIFLSLFWIRA